LSYADEGRSIMTHVLTDEFSTLRVAGPAEKCTVSLFGSSGTLVARKSRDLSPRRDIKLYGETFVFDHESRHVEVALPNAANPVGAYVSWQPRKSRPRDSVHDWDLEVQYAPVRRAQATLLAHKKFILYTGGTKERQRAMADIREFLNQYGTDSVRIWDPYFEARDLIEFLTAVNNSNADIRVLTNRRKQKGHDDLDAVKLWLKNPGPGVPPATSVSVRFFVGPSHDRFLLCGDKCWQLGSSLNHIGAKISTIVELPVSKPVWSAFEYAWERSKSW